MAFLIFRLVAGLAVSAIGVFVVYLAISGEVVRTFGPALLLTIAGVLLLYWGVQIMFSHSPD